MVRAETYDEAMGLINFNPHGNSTAILTNVGGIELGFPQNQ